VRWLSDFAASVDDVEEDEKLTSSAINLSLLFPTEEYESD